MSKVRKIITEMFSLMKADPVMRSHYRHYLRPDCPFAFLYDADLVASILLEPGPEEALIFVTSPTLRGI
jgi:hypothetical protein